MERLLEIAPLATWLRVAAAALLLLAGFVALGHARMLRKGGGAAPRGETRGFARVRWPGAPAARPTATLSALRWSGVLLGSGLTVWGVEQGWAAVVIGTLAALVVALLAVELAARARG